jgi:hypothetical protein
MAQMQSKVRRHSLNLIGQTVARLDRQRAKPRFCCNYSFGFLGHGRCGAHFLAVTNERLDQQHLHRDACPFGNGFQHVTLCSVYLKRQGLAWFFHGVFLGPGEQICSRSRRRLGRSSVPTGRPTSRPSS